MFTGIVEELGTVVSRGSATLAVSAPRIGSGIAASDSVAVNGVCLTATSVQGGQFIVDVMPETLRLTNLGLLRPGQRVNLERALQMGGRLGGHFVQGHVDGTGQVVGVQPEGEALLVTISGPPAVMRYVVQKGFIAVDGISLTVVERSEDRFVVSLVKFTQANSTLAVRRPGEVVNLESDILGKYVERFLAGDREVGRSDLSRGFLAEHGYL